jgi:hypothetical protein
MGQTEDLEVAEHGAQNQGRLRRVTAVVIMQEFYLRMFVVLELHNVCNIRITVDCYVNEIDRKEF